MMQKLILYFLIAASAVRKRMLKKDWLYKSLFAPQLVGFRELVGKWKAWRVFEKAKRDCPAYAQFIAESPGAEVVWRGLVPDLSKIPVTDKKNYVLKYSLRERCFFGDFPWRGGQVDESSGSSGKPNNWVRGPDERAEVGRIMQIAFRQLLGDKPVFFLNAFALGPWATGMSVSGFIADACLLKSIGPDEAKIITTLKDFGPEHHYVIAGYPPFLRNLVDSPEIEWSKYNITGFYGGEGISEGMRDYLGKGFKKVYGSYGASDLEINLAAENDFSIALRKLILANPALRARFCKYEGDPIVFQYNPMDYLIETNTDGELIITICRVENVAPKVRYNIHDRGQVFRFREVADILEEEGYSIADFNIDQIAELPVLLHFGRADLAVAFYGCKITPNEIEKVIFENNVLANCVDSFALVMNEDAQTIKTLTIALELRTGGVEPQDNEKLTREVFDQLAAANQDFRESRKMIAAGLQPTIKFYASRTGPFANRDIRLKSNYIRNTKSN